MKTEARGTENCLGLIKSDHNYPDACLDKKGSFVDQKVTEQNYFNIKK